MAQTIIKDIDDLYVIDKIYDEGILSMFSNYIDSSNILDPMLKQYAEALVLAADNIEEYLTDLEIRLNDADDDNSD